MIEIKFATYVHRIFHEILMMIAEDWNDCSKSDIEIHEIVNKAKISNLIANAIITLQAVAVLLYGDVILAKIDVTNHTIKLPHIYKIEVPFNINTQHTYKIVLIVELVHVLLCSCGAGILNALLLTLVSDIQENLQSINAYIHIFTHYNNSNKNK